MKNTQSRANRLRGGCEAQIPWRNATTARCGDVRKYLGVKGARFENGVYRFTCHNHWNNEATVFVPLDSIVFIPPPKKR